MIDLGDDGLAYLSGAGDVEEWLGDPFDPTQRFSFKRSVELDEQDSYPEEACALLNAVALQNFYIPVGLGGKLQGFDEMFLILRLVARRDLTVAIAHGKSFLGAIS